MGSRFYRQILAILWDPASRRSIHASGPPRTVYASSRTEIVTMQPVPGVTLIFISLHRPGSNICIPSCAKKTFALAVQGRRHIEGPNMLLSTSGRILECASIFNLLSSENILRTWPGVAYAVRLRLSRFKRMDALLLFHNIRLTVELVDLYYLLIYLKYSTYLGRYLSDTQKGDNCHWLRPVNPRLCRFRGNVGLGLRGSSVPNQ